MALTSSLSQIRPLQPQVQMQGAITQPSFQAQPQQFRGSVQTPGIITPQLNPNQIAGPAAGTGIIGPQVQPQTGGIRPPPITPPPPGINPPPGGGFGSGQSGPLIPNQPRFDGQTPPIVTPQFPGSGGIVPPGFPTAPPPQTGPPPGPQFGLAGAESARLQGAQAGANAFQQGSQQGLGTLLAGFNQAQSSIGQGINALGGNFASQAFGGTAGQGQAGQGQAGQGQATDVDPVTGLPLFQQGAQQSGQFIGGGVQAQQQGLALSGALGQEAFNQALINNPQLRFLEERGQAALANQTAASGGLGSGQFQIELQQLGQAQAAQDIQRQIQNAQGFTQQGIQAAGQSGQWLGQAGTQQGRLAGQNAAQRTQISGQNAGLRTQASLQNAQLQTQTSLQNAAAQSSASQANARNRLSAAQSQSGLFGQEAGIAGQLASTGAGFQQQTGRDTGQLLAGTASQIGADRFRAGQDIAGQINRTTGGLSQLQNQGGLNLADIISQFGGQAGGIVAGTGEQTAAQQQRLAQLLANLGIGVGGQLAGLEGQIGGAIAGGLTGQAGARSGTISDLAALLGDL